MSTRFYIRRFDQLQINDRINIKPVNITPDFKTKTYYSDVTIRITSNDFRGSFKLEPLPGMVG